MIATIWTREGCEACTKEKQFLKSEGYQIDVVVVEDESSMDRDAFAQLNCQDGKFPIIRINGTFRIPAKAAREMEW